VARGPVPQWLSGRRPPPRLRPKLTPRRTSGRGVFVCGPDWNRPPGGTFSPMMYRIQFLADALRIKAEWPIVAPDVAAAIALAKAAHWPARAVRMQILDDAGRMVHERLKADDR
jgi:hypothetical protein